jgi:hypothetical protein
LDLVTPRAAIEPTRLVLVFINAIYTFDIRLFWEKATLMPEFFPGSRGFQITFNSLNNTQRQVEKFSDAKIVLFLGRLLRYSSQRCGKLFGLFSEAYRSPLALTSGYRMVNFTVGFSRILYWAKAL